MCSGKKKIKNNLDYELRGIWKAEDN